MVERNNIDTLYRYDSEGIHCPNCGHSTNSIFILAEDKFEADSMHKYGGGLCGDCQCSNIMETHGGVVTLPEPINS